MVSCAAERLAALTDVRGNVMRKTILCLATTLAVAVFAAPAQAALFTYGVSEDALISGAPSLVDGNFGGELFLGTGSDGIDDPIAQDSPLRFLLKFDLSMYPYNILQSARLVGFYLDDWDWFVNSTHSILVADNGWTENTVTWNNQPTTGAAAAVFDAADPAYAVFRTNNGFFGDYISWDVTSAVSNALAGGALSLMFRADDETVTGNPNLEFFGARESGFGFALQIVPEPATMLLLATGLVAALRRARA